jgi:hypothetical protein
MKSTILVYSVADFVNTIMNCRKKPPGGHGEVNHKTGLKMDFRV